MAATAATGGILDEAEFVELQEMLDKLLLIKYTDVLARQGLGLSALLELTFPQGGGQMGKLAVRTSSPAISPVIVALMERLLRD